MVTSPLDRLLRLSLSSSTPVRPTSGSPRPIAAPLPASSTAVSTPTNPRPSSLTAPNLASSTALDRSRVSSATTTSRLAASSSSIRTLASLSRSPVSPLPLASLMVSLVLAMTPSPSWVLSPPSTTLSTRAWSMRPSLVSTWLMLTVPPVAR